MTARRDALGAPIARGLKAPESDVTRDAAIQRFEFCFELAWKSVQERARDDGLDCQSPRDCLRIAFKTSWIENEQGWLAMLDDRNRTSDTYDEDMAKAVFRRLPNYLPLLDSLLNKLNS
jgi:nucleotidyltransferase substrate binding protein (TIGR01987 family)